MSEELLPSKRSLAHIRHGHTSAIVGKSRQSPTYITWQAMRARCRLVERDVEEKYAKRGIGFDPAWDDFKTFLSDMGERPDGMTIDRINNDLGYSADNCRWATPIEQARNRRNARLTYPQAVEVAVRRMLGESCKSLASEFGCSESLPREIVKGRSWKDAALEAKQIVEGSQHG